jgi:hypothetical protein
MKTWQAALVSLVLAAGPLLAAPAPPAQAPPTREEVRSFLVEYLRADFDGGSDFRIAHARWDSTARKALRALGQREPGRCDLLEDPFLLVDKFDLAGLTLDGAAGTATLRYHRVAWTEGRGAQRKLLLGDRALEETVTWRFVDGALRLENPGLPKVGLRGVLRAYERACKGLYDESDGRLTFRCPKDWPAEGPRARRAAKDVADLMRLRGLTAHVN